MNDYKFMVLSTGFIKKIDGHNVDFTMTVDCTGNVRIKPTLPEAVKKLFPDGLVMEIFEDELLIYPFKNK
jgi:hypothetical protein